MKKITLFYFSMVYVFCFLFLSMLMPRISYAVGEPTSVDPNVTEFTYKARNFIVALSRLRTESNEQGPWGLGWTHPYDVKLQIKANGDVVYSDPRLPSDKDRFVFRRDPSTNTYTSAPGVYYTLSKDINGLFTLTDKLAIKMLFNSNLQISKVVDRNGNELVFGYTGTDLMSITDPGGRIVQFTYSAGRISRITDPIGRVFQYQYTGGLLTKVIYPDGFNYQYTYDSKNRLTSIKDRGSNTTTMSYGDTSVNITSPSGSSSEVHINDLGDSVVKVTDPKGNTRTIRKNSLGLTTEIIDELGRRSQTFYDACRNPIKEIDFNNGVIRRKFDDSGNILVLIDQDSRVWRYGYNAFSLPTKRTNPVGDIETIEYNAKGKPTRLTDFTGATIATHTYDQFGNRISSQDALGNLSTYEYDVHGNITKFIDPLGFVREYTFDALSRMLTNKNPMGAVTTFEYDNAGNLVKITLANGSVIERVYDANNRLISEKDPAGNARALVYDTASRMIKSEDPDGNSLQLGYDANSNHTTTTDGMGNITRFTLDASNRTINVIHPAVGSVNPIDTFFYDQNGLVNRRIKPTGDTIGYEFDSSGNLIKRSFSDGKAASFSYDTMGRMVKMVDWNGTWQYDYNKVGLLKKVIRPDNRSISYTYDAARNKTTMIDWQNRTTNYEYDANGRLTKVTDPDGNATTYGYDNNGSIVKTTYPNGSVSDYVISVVGSLDKVINKKANGDTLSSFAYAYDTAGNKIQMVEDDGSVTNWKYDKAGQLIQERKTNASGDTIFAFEYGYDSAYNRIFKKNLTTGDSVSYGYSGDLMVRGGNITYSYDLEGKLISEGDGAETKTLAYDAENRLVRAAFSNPAKPAINLVYNAEGELIQRSTATGDTVILVNDREDLLAEISDTGEVRSLFLYRPHSVDIPISVKRGNSVYYFFYDAVGSITELTTDTSSPGRVPKSVEILRAHSS